MPKRPLRKLMICPWFGPKPEWLPLYHRNAATLRYFGWDWLYTSDLDIFARRVNRLLGIRCPIEPGSGKIHDYRASFGVLFADQIHGYDFWGHTDFDCVYGRLERFVTDDLLSEIDVYSDHWDYICGPLALFRVDSLATELFLESPQWEQILSAEETTGWVETSYTELVNKSDLRVHYQVQHVWEAEDLERLSWEGRRLILDDEERSMAHFRRTKRYPEALK
jgi:hypothetical protein